MELLAHTPEEIAAFTHVLHDYWFDVDYICANMHNEVISINFYHSQRLLKKGISAYKLIVRHVQAINVRDSEKIGYYDLNLIEFDCDSRSICIRGNIPICIQIRVALIEAQLIQDQLMEGAEISTR